MRIMVDAEQSYIQPAIDALVIHLQQHYNRQEPVVFNTYQCYLQDTPTRYVPLFKHNDVATLSCKQVNQNI